MPLRRFSRAGPPGGDGQDEGLDTVPLLALLEPDLRRQVRKRLSRRAISAGKTLYRQGEPSDALYFIHAGRFRVSVGERAGQEHVLRFLGPGEIIGESAFMAETTHVTSAVAVDNGAVWRLSRADFDALLGAHPDALRYIAGFITDNQAQANARLAANTGDDAVRSQRGCVTAVYSPRGGAGVTTLALNLAIALAERHPDDAVLVDLDVLFGNVATSLWLEPRGVLAQVSPASLRDLDRNGLDFYLLRHTSSLRILSASTRPDEGQLVTGDHVRAAIDTLRSHFGSIVLDLPHTFHEVTLAGLELADRVLVVATPEPLVLHDVLECRRIFTDALQLPAEHLSYVLNHPQPYAALARDQFSAATNTAWSEVPYGGDAPATAALRGESLLDTHPGNSVARAAVQLAARIETQAPEPGALSVPPG